MRLNSTVIPLELHQDQAADMITSQVNFGMAYAKEARMAFEAGNLEYAEVSRKIAVNAHAAAVRFSGRLPYGADANSAFEIQQLELEIEQLTHADGELSLRSIA